MQYECIISKSLAHIDFPPNLDFFHLYHKVLSYLTLRSLRWFGPFKTLMIKSSSHDIQNLNQIPCLPPYTAFTFSF